MTYVDYLRSRPFRDLDHVEQRVVGAHVFQGEIRDAGPATVAVTLTFQGRQTATIKNFVARNATEAIAREFQNGVVLCNTNTSPCVFDLGALFPDVSLRRLKGSPYDTFMNAINTGEVVGTTVQGAKCSEPRCCR